MAVHRYERVGRRARSESSLSRILRSQRHCAQSPTSWRHPSQRPFGPEKAFAARWQAVVKLDRVHCEARGNFAGFAHPTRQRTCGDSLASSLEPAWNTLSRSGDSNAASGEHCSAAPLVGHHGGLFCARQDQPSVTQSPTERILRRQKQHGESQLRRLRGQPLPICAVMRTAMHVVSDPGEPGAGRITRLDAYGRALNDLSCFHRQVRRQHCRREPRAHRSAWVRDSSIKAEQQV